MILESAYKTLKEGSQKLALQNATQKNNALKAVAQALDKNRKSIIDANKIDIENHCSHNSYFCCICINLNFK